ncbi:histidine phosphatase family protein [Paenibacillus allorhizosphaerae]|uniref:Histidine phosphatase family protein n=1 Tax=Paenibacillus allorhizosphaerae TaxID=2849866 RepID=A0ABN7TMA1_9BACL|nr:histidine phosphatase family protein [Paenibacillus allorhizosphaerae]CAG7646858.1 hypothetical protein PAECIP111802_03849 [Paenibacillus allorhizosphaerae]
MKKIYVIRHCKAEGQAAGAPLTETGLKQAALLADFLSDRDIDSITSSPFERAYRTIEPLALRLRLPIATDDRLAERVLSVRQHPDWRERLRSTYDDMDLCFEGGESSRTAMGRAANVVKEALASEHRNIAVVSHGNLISLLLKQFDERIGYAEWEALTNPDVYLLSFSAPLQHPPDIRRIWTD